MPITDPGATHVLTQKYYLCPDCKEATAATSFTSNEAMLGMVKPSAPPAPPNSAEQRVLASSIAEHSHELATDRVRRHESKIPTFFTGDKTADRQFKFQDVTPIDACPTKLISQDHHFQNDANCKHQAATMRSGMTSEGAAILAARRIMKKEAADKLYLQAKQNDSTPPSGTLSYHGKTTLGGAFTHSIPRDEGLRKIGREGYSEFSAKLAEYKLMRQELVSSIT